MIAVDASAILAILLREPEGAGFVTRFHPSGGRISPVNHWEVMVRAYGLGGDGGVIEARRLLRELGVEVAEVGEPASRAAFDAFVRFGKGTGRGPLNLGDCFAYEVAKEHACRLLYVGDDFSKTDIEVVL